jgi:putative FmdB family regulatory protein
MPTYEYACRSCGSHLEVVQAFSDEPLTGCPTCGGPLRKVFGSIGITFKGSGFYRTDSRSSSTGRRREGETADAARKTDTTESATKGDRGGKGDSGGKGSESSSSGGAKESTAAKSA